MQDQITYALPKTPMNSTLDVRDLLLVTSRLKDILTAETEQLKQMKVKELGHLQHEKQKLTKLLESYQMLIKSNPGLLDTLDEETREDLAYQGAEFTRVVEENFRHVSVARAINQRIVQAILDVVSERDHAGTYSKRGMTTAPNMALSFNLNQKA